MHVRVDDGLNISCNCNYNYNMNSYGRDKKEKTTDTTHQDQKEGRSCMNNNANQGLTGTSRLK
jgi:hypothetical protein